MKPLHIAPNIPLYVKLVDPDGDYDSVLKKSTYETTCGQLLTLPYEAIVKLNALGVRPGEEVQITKHWSGKAGEGVRWTIALANSTEKARAEAGEPDSLTQQLQASIDQSLERKSNTPPPTPIRKPAAPAQVEQPKLFDRRGTGTHGPALEPMPAPAALPQVARASSKTPTGRPIPANVAVREILAFISTDPNTLNWGDQAKQDLASTVIIAEYRQGRIGLWERGE